MIFIQDLCFSLKALGNILGKYAYPDNLAVFAEYGKNRVVEISSIPLVLELNRLA